MIDSILTFVFWFIVGWVAFRVLLNWAGSYAQQRIEQLDREITEIKKKYKLVKVEEYSGIFYLFDTENNQFLGQGRTAEELASNLGRDLTIRIVEGDPDVIARFRSSIPKVEADPA